MVNGTCDNGLVCELQGSNGKCVPPSSDGSVVDAPNKDGQTNDSGSDSPVDAPKDASLSCDADSAGPVNALALCSTPNPPAVACYNLGDAAVTCATFGQCAPSTFQAECLSNGGFKCCLVDAGFASPACFPTLDLTNGAYSYLITNNNIACGGLIMCDGGAQCQKFLDGSTCEAVGVTGVPALATQFIGVCQ